MYLSCYEVVFEVDLLCFKWYLRSTCSVIKWSLRWTCSVIKWSLRWTCSVIRWSLRWTCSVFKWYLRSTCPVIKWSLKWACLNFKWSPNRRPTILSSGFYIGPVLVASGLLGSVHVLLYLSLPLMLSTAPEALLQHCSTTLWHWLYKESVWTPYSDNNMMMRVIQLVFETVETWRRL